MRIAAILNRESGTLRSMDLGGFCSEAEAAFSEAGHELCCRVVSGTEVLSALEEVAADANFDAMVAAGGDGTISSAAAIAYQSRKPLGVLPAGTMNLFCRALGMPSDVRQAMRAVAGGRVGSVDLAFANEQPFVHQFNIGIHARLVRIRDGMEYRSRFGKMFASLRAIAASAVNPPNFEIEIDRGFGLERRRVSGVTISNNPLGEGPLPVARCLDSGKLGVYIASTVTSAELIGLVADVLVGRWRANPVVTEITTDRLALSFPQRKRGVQAVVDGELSRLERRVELKILPKALPVILPAPLD